MTGIAITRDNVRHPINGGCTSDLERASNDLGATVMLVDMEQGYRDIYQVWPGEGWIFLGSRGPQK